MLLPSGETRNYISVQKERSRLRDRSKDQLISFPVVIGYFYICMQFYSLRIWSSCCIVCDCVVLAILPHHGLFHDIALNPLGCWGREVYIWILVPLILFWLGVQIIIFWFRDIVFKSWHYIILRAISLVCNLCKMCGVLPTYSITFCCGIVVINQIHVCKLAFFPVLFIIF